MPFPSPGDLPDPEIKPTSPALAGGFFTTEPPGKPLGFLGQVTNAVSGSAAKLLISPPLPWRHKEDLEPGSASRCSPGGGGATPVSALLALLRVSHWGSLFPSLSSGLSTVIIPNLLPDILPGELQFPLSLPHPLILPARS